MLSAFTAVSVFSTFSALTAFFSTSAGAGVSSLTSFTAFLTGFSGAGSAFFSTFLAVVSAFADFASTFTFSALSSFFWQPLPISFLFGF